MLFLPISKIFSQDLPEDAVDFDFNGYFDNFGVNVIYPSISVSKQVSQTTSINARYLSDVITAASMKSHFDKVYSTENQKFGLDALASASKRTQGGPDNKPDEWRSEFGFGVTHLFGDITLSLNNLYSIEHDYSSESVTGSLEIPFAKKNTVLNIGFVNSWDRIYPQTRFWTAKKDVFSGNVGLSQIFSTHFITQLDLSYSYLNGFLDDPYEIVTVQNYKNPFYALYEPITPDKRTRLAAGLRGIYRLGENNSITLGYRYYKDDWGIKSNTLSGLYQHEFYDDKLLLGASIRTYFQTKADFFKAVYDSVEQYMVVDSKLNGLISEEFELKCNINGSLISFINNDKIELKCVLDYYVRTTDSPDWFSRMKTLYAYIVTVGFRYLLN